MPPSAHDRVINSLAKGPVYRSKLMPKVDSSRTANTRRAQVSTALDELMHEGTIQMAHGRDGTVFYLTAHEKTLISEGLLSRETHSASIDLLQELGENRQIEVMRRFGKEW